MKYFNVCQTNIHLELFRCIWYHFRPKYTRWFLSVPFSPAVYEFVNQRRRHVWKEKSWKDTDKRAYETGVEKTPKQLFTILSNLYICHATWKTQKLAFWKHYKIYQLSCWHCNPEHLQDGSARKVHLQRYWEVCGSPSWRIQTLLECVI